MPTGPQRLILIRSGCYEYAEIELTGALQIVGPNNTGKTALINTLQFLYLDDRRHMDFGSYTAEQTREFYFLNQYSYVLFECLGATGKCVIGWRGQSKTSGGEPERFFHVGPFDRSDFLDGRNQVREAREVSARLALKQFRAIKSAQEHREWLLPAANGDGQGLGELVWRWTDLRSQCQRFEQDNHDTRVDRREAQTEQEARMQNLEAEAAERHGNVTTLSEQKGQLLAPLKSIEAQDSEFKGFPEELERAALSNLKQEVRELELQLASAEGESREKAKRNFDALADRVKQKEHAIARFDHLAVTALRKHFTAEE